MLENHGDGDHGGLKRKTTGLLVAPQQLAQIHDAEHFVGIPAHDRKECVFRCADELEEGFRRLVAVEPLHLMGVIMYRTVRPPKRMTRATMARSSGLNTLSRQSE